MNVFETAAKAKFSHVGIVCTKSAVSLETTTMRRFTD
jgi:hypothetical protein